jgi:hypothetical protein
MINLGNSPLVLVMALDPGKGTEEIYHMPPHYAEPGSGRVMEVHTSERCSIYTLRISWMILSWEKQYTLSTSRCTLF